MFGFEKNGVKNIKDTEKEQVVDVDRRNFLRQGAAAVGGIGIAAMGMAPESVEAADHLQVEQVNLKLTSHQLMMVKINIQKLFPDAVSVEISDTTSSNTDPIKSVYLSVLTKTGKVHESSGAGFDIGNALPAALKRFPTSE